MSHFASLKSYSSFYCFHGFQILYTLLEPHHGPQKCTGTHQLASSADEAAVQRRQTARLNLVVSQQQIWAKPRPLFSRPVHPVLTRSGSGATVTVPMLPSLAHHFQLFKRKLKGLDHKTLSLRETVGDPSLLPPQLCESRVLGTLPPTVSESENTVLARREHHGPV